jgi:hypothetical protein
MLCEQFYKLQSQTLYASRKQKCQLFLKEWCCPCWGLIFLAILNCQQRVVVVVFWLHGDSLGAIGERHIDNHSASVQFCTEEGQAWWLTCVYGPQGNERKVQFLQELHEIRSICHRPWMIAGDFNLIYKAEDNNNGNYNTAMMG